MHAWCAALLAPWPLEAIRAARRAVELAPDQPTAHLVLGVVLHASAKFPSPGDRAETLAALDRVLELDPANRRALELLPKAKRPRRERLLRRLGWALLIGLVLGGLGAVLTSLVLGGHDDSGSADTGWFSGRQLIYPVIGAVLAIGWLRTAHRRGGVWAAVLRRRTLSRELNISGGGVDTLAPSAAAGVPLLSSIAAFPVAAPLADGTAPASPVLALAAALASGALASAAVWWIGHSNARRCIAVSALLRVYALLAIVVVSGTNVLAWDFSLSTGWWNLVCIGLACWTFGGGLFALARAHSASRRVTT